MFDDSIDINEPDPAIVNLKIKIESKLSQTGLVWKMVELQLIKFNKMAEKQRWRRLRSKIWRYILKTILYTFNPWLAWENVTTVIKTPQTA